MLAKGDKPPTPAKTVGKGRLSVSQNLCIVKWHDKAIDRENLLPFIMQRLKVTLAFMSER